MQLQETDVAQMLQYISDWSENILGNGENACYQCFPLFQQYF